MLQILRIALTLVALATAVGESSASAGDHFRKLGIGYGAGYNAPAPCGGTGFCAKHSAYHGWKEACCVPGSPAPATCGCAPCCAPPVCPTPCLTLPCLPTLRVPCSTCPPCGFGPMPRPAAALN
ncbi:MAG: hypothetical protein QM775_05800 [Pirellulales bacterium]